MFAFRHGDRPLEGYTILRGLGRGGFGEVYYAVSDGGREVALKVIQQNHDVELRGVRHCMNLKNPHLVTIFDVKRSDEGAPFVIMEYVSGRAIRDVLRQHADGLGVAKAAFLVREIAKGLGYLHDAGIVHRDLKPENIFFEDGYVKIGDYGLSKYISVSRHSGQTISVGTVHYMAPEIGSGNYTRGIDIYALGVIFYELLTGSVPFDGDSMGEILMKHLSVPPDVDTIDPELRPIVWKALEKNPADRYETVGALVDDLTAIPSVARALETVDAASFTSSTKLERAETVPGVSPAPGRDRPPAREGLETVATPDVPARAVPHAAGQPARDARPAGDAGAGRGAARVDAEPGNPEARRTASWQQSVVLGLSTAVAMSLGMTLIGQQAPGSFLGYLLTILAGSGSVLLVGCYLGPRLGIEAGIPQRLMNVAVGFPLLILARLATFERVAFDTPEFPLFTLFAGLFLINWQERLDPRRSERISLHQAFLAALFGVVADYLVFQGFQLLSAGLFAGMSLVVNGMARYGPTKGARSPSPRQGRAAQRHVARQARQPGQPVGGPPGDANRSRPQPASGPTELAATASTPPQAVERPSATAPPFRAAPSPERRARPVHRSLTRPLRGRVLAGVCAGLAARYNWDVALVRLVFALGTFFTMGQGLLVYVIFWACTPGEKAGAVWRQSLSGGGAQPAAVARRPRVPRRPPPLSRSQAAKGRPPPTAPGPGPGTKAFFYTLAFLVLAAGVTLVAALHLRFFDRFAPRQPLEMASLYAPGLFLCYGAGALWLIGKTFGRLSFLRVGFVLPVLVLSLTIASASAVAIYLVDRFEARPTESAVSWLLLALSILASVWMTTLVRSDLRRTAPEGGWTASAMLGGAFVGIAALVAFGGALLGESYGPGWLVDPVRNSPEFQFAQLSHRGYHFFVALLIFLPGLFCLLHARRRGGPAHVLRGAIGWLTCCVLLGVIASQLPMLIHHYPVEGWQVQSYHGLFAPSWVEISAFLSLATFALLVLTWPSRRAGTDSPRTAEGVER